GSDRGLSPYETPARRRRIGRSASEPSLGSCGRPPTLAPASTPAAVRGWPLPNGVPRCPGRRAGSGRPPLCREGASEGQSAGHPAVGSWRSPRRGKWQKAKGKWQKANVKTTSNRGDHAYPTLAICHLPFDFCLLPFLAFLPTADCRL